MDLQHKLIDDIADALIAQGGKEWKSLSIEKSFRWKAVTFISLTMMVFYTSISTEPQINRYFTAKGNPKVLLLLSIFGEGTYKDASHWDASRRKQ